VEVTWLPFLLRPGMPPEGMPVPSYARGSQATALRSRLKQMAEANGLEMVFGEWVPNSHRALEAAEYARTQGKHDPFHKIVFRKYYGDGQDISRWDVLRSAALEAGLDPDDMQEQTESGRYRAVVGQHFEEAQHIGVSSIPTYVLSGRYAVVGAQTYEVFLQAIERFQSEGRET